jgi:putative transposase
VIDFKKVSHTIYECKYHIVFCPKYRYRIFDGQIGEYAKQQVYHLARRKDLVEVKEINVQPDHVHTILSVPPKYAVSDIMGFSKWRC